MVESMLAEYVARHNHGISSGEFAPMLELFHADAELVFVGLLVGPFVGRDAIAAAFRDNPPDDALVLLSSSADGMQVSGRYGWRHEPAMPAGTLEMALRDGRIARLTVDVDG